MSTTYLTAGTVMDRVAALMNDTTRAVYTYAVVLPYLNTAIDELQEILEVAGMSPTKKTAAYITLPIGSEKLTPVEDATTPHYPMDLIEVDNISERTSGTSDPFILMNRRDYLNQRTPNNNLLDWAWIDQIIQFYTGGATSIRELKLDYVRQPLAMATTENTVISTINARSYLSFKTAALCSAFIGENETRAGKLEGKAEEAIDRILGIDSKANQNIYTRRRPFRSSYKSRGYY